MRIDFVDFFSIEIHLDWILFSLFWHFHKWYFIFQQNIILLEIFQRALMGNSKSNSCYSSIRIIQDKQNIDTAAKFLNYFLNFKLKLINGFAYIVSSESVFMQRIRAVRWRVWSILFSYSKDDTKQYLALTMEA